MLVSLSIKNFAIVERLKLDFSPGFNIITGETGAGKSVITGAIGLLLGGRTDKQMIRGGAERAELEAFFHCEKKTACDVMVLLNELEIPFDLQENGAIELQIRRSIGVNSTRNFVNDISVTAQFLGKLSELLLDLHAANEHYSLSKNSVQLHLLDRFAQSETLLNKCKFLNNKYLQLLSDKKNLCETLPNAQKAQELRLQKEEIELAQLKPNEDQEISTHYARVAAAQELSSLASLSQQLLTENEGNIADNVVELQRFAERLAHLDPLEGERLKKSLEQIADLLHDYELDLSRYARTIECDESLLLQLDTRLTLIQKLKRRYGPTLDDVHLYLMHIDKQLDAFESAEEHLNKLEEEIIETEKQHTILALKLRELRQKASAHLSNEVTLLLNKLGFLKSSFSVAFSEHTLGATGMDKIEFIFTANLGETPAPLQQIASSGEISRVMLAIKAVLANADEVPVLVFDEIDVNIGGETAGIVGDELKRLALGHQVICISHLAQVAVRGEQHIYVSKQIELNRTLTIAEVLNTDGKIREIARMLGGGIAAIRHAKELLK